MSADWLDRRDTMLGNMNGTLADMMDSGLGGTDLYSALEQSRNNVAGAIPTDSSYESTYSAADSYMQQADDMLHGQAAQPTSDTGYAEPLCDCAPGEPCCITAVTIGCSHGGTRLSLPLASDDDEAVVAVVCSETGSPPLDKLSVSMNRSSVASCAQPGQRPSIRLLGRGVNSAMGLSGSASVPIVDQTFHTDSFKYEMQYHADYGDTSSDLAKFIRATRMALFSDINDLGQRYSMTVRNCTFMTMFDADIIAFPKVEWTAKGFSYSISAKIGRNVATPSITYSGEIGGVFGASEFQLKAESEQTDTPEGEESEKLIPFLAESMKALRSEAKANEPTSAGGSSVEISHGVSLGDSTYKVEEHPDDPSKVGISADISIGLTPFFGIKVTIDLIEVMIIAASTAFPALARGLLEARERVARGFGSNEEGAETAIQGSLETTVNFVAEGEINGTLNMTHAVGATQWEIASRVGGEIGASVEAVIRVEGRIVFVKGALSAEATAQTKIKANITELTASQRASSGKKMRTKVEWDGLSVTYTARGRVQVGEMLSASGSNGGVLVLCPERVLYDKTT